MSKGKNSGSGTGRGKDAGTGAGNLARPPKEPEFSWPFNVEELRERPEAIVIYANPRQREALAGRLDILAVEDFKADCTVRRLQGYLIEVKGYLKASVVQRCVVTAEPVQAFVEDSFEGYFGGETEAISFAKARRARILENQDPEVPFLDEKDDPEPVVDGHIDLGELATQYLSLALDPYPHKDGVVHELSDEDEARLDALRASRTPNPFARLEAMKKTLEEKEAGKDTPRGGDRRD